MSETNALITSDFLLNSIKRKLPQSDILMNSFQITNGTMKGENFASDVTRIMVNYLMNGRSQTKTFILKALINSEEELQFERVYHFFGIEINIYENILPQIELRLQSIGNTQVLSPM